MQEERLRKSILPETAPLVRQTAGAAWGRADSRIWSVGTRTPLPKREKLKIKDSQEVAEGAILSSFGNPVLSNGMIFFEQLSGEMSAVFPDLCKNLDSSFQHCLVQYEPFLSSSLSYFRLIFLISAPTALPGIWLLLQNKIFTLFRACMVPGGVTNGDGTAMQ